MDDNSDNGIKINLISSRKLDSMTSQEKLRFIIDEIKKGTVLVLERGLTAEEEINLIKTTMSEIDHQTFIGIEMQSYSAQDLEANSWINKLLGRARVPKMSVIGPANLLKTIHKNGSIIQAMILTGESIVDNLPKGDKDEPRSETEPMEATPENGALQPEAGSEIEVEATITSELATDEPQGEVDTEQYNEPITEPANEQESHETIATDGYMPEQQTGSTLTVKQPKDPEESRSNDMTSPAYSGPPDATTEPLPPGESTTFDEAPPQVVTEPPIEPDQIQTEPPYEQPPPEYPAQEQTQNEPAQGQPEQTEPVPGQEGHGTGFLYKRLKQEEE